MLHKCIHGCECSRLLARLQLLCLLPQSRHVC
jgi:hypothetical protein